MSDLEFGAMEERRKQREKEREAEETWAEESSWLPDHMSDQEWRDLEKAADLEESLYRLELDARFEKIERRHEQDVELARRVEIELLRERESLRGEIDVMAHDGVVLLQGRLGSPEEVIQLEAQARKVRGVTEVENLMKP